MDILNPEYVIRLHDELINEFGGEGGLLNKSSLLSSLARPFTGTANGKEYYPTIVEKAGALIHSLIKNHPFVDGNKRTAAQVTKIFLRGNKYDWNFEDEEIIKFVLDIAQNLVDLSYINEWIAKRITKLEI